MRIQQNIALATNKARLYYIYIYIYMLKILSKWKYTRKNFSFLQFLKYYYSRPMKYALSK
jgi:hypothetical protein